MKSNKLQKLKIITMYLNMKSFLNHKLTVFRYTDNLSQKQAIKFELFYENLYIL